MHLPLSFYVMFFDFDGAAECIFHFIYTLKMFLGFLEVTQKLSNLKESSKSQFLPLGLPIWSKLLK